MDRDQTRTNGDRSTLEHPTRQLGAPPFAKNRRKGGPPAADASWARTEIYAGGAHIGTYSGDATYFEHSDWLGTVRVRTGPTGAVVQSCTSEWFGDGQNCSGTDASPIRFTGQELDAESNLNHFWFRQYSSAQGRWTTPDPAGLAAVSVSDPQSWNRYGYVSNNPLIAIDPLGLRWEPICKGCSTYIWVPDANDNCPSDGCSLSPGTNFSSVPGGTNPFTRSHFMICSGPGEVSLARCVPVVFPGIVHRGTSVDTVGAAGNRPSDCRYVDPLAAGIELTGKFGPSIEIANFNLGASVKKTVGGDASTEAVAGFKGILSIQRTNDNVWAGSGERYSVTILGFSKQLYAGDLLKLFSRSGWQFSPSKEIKVGFQAFLGFEVGWNSEKAKEAVDRNRACGYSGPPGS